MVQIICAVFVYGMNAFLPNVLNVMKYIGAAYVLWLAIHIAISKPDSENTGKSFSFFKGFLLQFVNVKIYLFGITALTGYVTDYSTSFEVLLLFEMMIATITWIGMGIIIQRIYQKHFRFINIILAAALLECVYSMIK